MFYYFLVELLTYYGTTKFHGHWPSNRKFTDGGRDPPPPRPCQILKSQACLGLTICLRYRVKPGDVSPQIGFS